MSIGVFNLGAVLFVAWVMTALIFILQFTKLADEVLLIVCFGGSLGAAIGLQMLLHSMEVPYMLAAIICAFIGLILILIGRAISARLYEKIDL